MTCHRQNLHPEALKSILTEFMQTRNGPRGKKIEVYRKQKTTKYHAKIETLMSHNSLKTQKFQSPSRYLSSVGQGLSNDTSLVQFGVAFKCDGHTAAAYF